MRTLKKLPPSGATYRVDKDDDERTYIICLVCRRRSYHPDDVQEKYCGFCQQFHEFMALPNLG